ncbi:MAG: glucuronate isomerase, partial [Intestinibacter sp.]|uniref:glucuronate isomerase n=1 Tax=Intestinibacter sp. TaxID=1965304 RepID=UPI003F16F2A1
MKNFMDKDFLLSNEISKKLYHEYSSVMPIIDYHCHINPQEIAEDKKFENITQVWLGGDHYKWRQMRSNGVEEKYITGDATDREKFQKWAETLEKAIGNPLYHWSHLELQRYFRYEGALNGETAEEVWNLCNEKLKTMSARSIMRDSNVELICTTDDPIDDLKYHIAIKEDETFDIQVLPTWRPDKAIAIEKVDYVDYIAKLSDVSEIEIKSFADWKQAITKRMEFFNEVGCKISDHGLLYIPYVEADEDTVDNIFKKRLAGENISETEELQFKTACMLYVGGEYSRLGWAMQLHFGVTRDNNTKMFTRLGVDTGFDGIYNRVSIDQLSSYLDALNKEDKLPKTILYSLNPVDNAAIGVLIGCFQEAGVCGKIQQGSAWWFNDHKAGMIEQMTSLANLSLLGNFIGMLTDSRSFLSYTRHE